MERERWMEIQRLAQQALQLPPKERAGFLREACGSNATLGAEALRLIDAVDSDDTPVRAAIESAARGVVDESRGALIGRQIGAWRIIERVAVGGMGAVYRAERVTGDFEQQAALKLVSPALLSQEVLARFHGERQILANLNHPNIARLLDGGATEDGLPYLVMEYIEGQPIDAWCRSRKLDTAARLRLFRKVCAAVDYAHKNLVVHRDIKPSNILVDASGEPRLLDFGVAKLIDSDQLGPRAAATIADRRLLTPKYASPEQISGQPITTATDVYSLGVLLYELLTDRLPYRDNPDSLAGLQRSICEVEPERPSAAVTRNGAAAVRGESPFKLKRELSGDLDEIVLMALRKEPAARYASVALLSEDIARFLDHRPIHVRGADWRYRSIKFMRRRRGNVAAAATVLALIVAATVLHAQRLAAERDRALTAERVAEREADAARAVAEFLVDTFSGVDPFAQKPNPDITARELLDRAVENLAADGESDIVLRRVGLTMGRAYAGLGLPARAREIGERAAEEMEARGETRTPEYGDALRLLALATALQDDWTEARTIGERALSIYERLPDERTVEVAQTLAFLSRVYRMLGDREADLNAAERAFTILRSAKGPDAIATLDALNVLSIAIAQAGRWESGIEHLRLAREGYIRQLGPTHAKVVETYRSEALINYRQGRYRDGLAMAERAVEAARATVGASNPLVVPALRMVYVNATHLGDTPRAYQAIRSAIDILESSPEPNRENLHLAYSNIGKLLMDEGYIDQAEQWLRRELEILRNTYGPESSQFGYSHMYFGILARMRGDYPAARVHLDRAVAAQNRGWGPEHVETLKMRVHREYIECFAGQPERAAKGLSEIVQILDRSVGPDHPISAQALGYLAVANAKSGNHALAHEQFEQAIERLERRSGSSIQFREALRSYSEFVSASGSEAEARTARDRLESIEAQRTRLQAADLL